MARQRDAATWSSIYSQHYEAIYRYLYGRLGRKEESEDLASQVFLEALQCIDSFVDVGKPLTAWLFGIARNLANNSVRRTKRIGVADSLQAEDLESKLTGLPGEMTPDSLDLIAGLDGLTKDQREALILRFYVGLSAKEVGRVLGKTELAVYSLQVRGIAALRRLIGDEAPKRRELAA